MFLRTLGESCEKSGWQIFAWVLMMNHYHWVLRTPEANLVSGMKWFQNTYTRRFNTRHRKWGHVFGGRYKAILVQEAGGDYLETLMDYVHLNPARAGLVDPEKGLGLLDYEWSSLVRGYAREADQRPAWLAVAEGLGLFGRTDTVEDRRGFVERLEGRVGEERGPGAGTGLQSTLQRGWYWGSQEFREKMLGLVPRMLANRNYSTSSLGRNKETLEAEDWIERAREHFRVGDQGMDKAPRPARVAAAWALHRRTNQPQGWIAEKLGLRTAANVSQQVRRCDSLDPPAFTKCEEWRRWVDLVKESSTDSPKRTAPIDGGGQSLYQPD